MLCRPLSCICGCRIPLRIIVAVCGVLGVIVGYGQRQNFNVAITRIVDRQIRVGNVTDCPAVNETEYGENIKGGSLNWTENMQGYMLGSFYVGYSIGQIPAGILADQIGGRKTYTMADQIGGRKTYTMGVGISSTFTLVFPFIIMETPWYCVCVGRIFMGIAQGVTYPSLSVLIAHWVPPSERATLGALAFSANSLGAVIGNILTGILMRYTQHWHSVFYFWGAMGIIWCICYLIWVYDTPALHPNITEREKMFLEREVDHYVKLKIPYKRILTDKGIVSLIIGQIGNDLTVYISLITSIPFICVWLVGILSGRLFDWGIKKKGWSVKWSRRVGCWVAFLLPNSLLVLMVYAECNVILVTLCFVFACATKGPHYASFKVNHMDITVNFNGFVMSIVNTAGTLGGFLSPVMISAMAPGNRLYEWKLVMWVIFGIAAFFTTYYLFLAQATRAEWDVPEDEMEAYKAERNRSAMSKEERKAQKKALKESKAAAPSTA
ncbi:Major Facilitator Superfamily [Popillia japonica]|uniref:Major Facilitator Superfamily n=1 Tax=Popillia japonica TaxID=7064 RepID=A0AAW1IU67_POPJA